jgi:hypothetical protein
MSPAVALLVGIFLIWIVASGKAQAVWSAITGAAGGGSNGGSGRPPDPSSGGGGDFPLGPNWTA